MLPEQTSGRTQTVNLGFETPHVCRESRISLQISRDRIYAPYGRRVAGSPPTKLPRFLLAQLDLERTLRTPFSSTPSRRSLQPIMRVLTTGSTLVVGAARLGSAVTRDAIRPGIRTARVGAVRGFARRRALQTVSRSARK